MTGIVARPEAVTPGWVSEVLHSAGHRDVRVVEVEGERIGTGQVGQCVRFTLRYAPEGDWETAPPSLVGKFASDDPKSCQAGVEQDCYVKEVGFYRELQPTVDIRTPRCYFAEIRGRGPEFALVLEDLAPARQGDQLEGCTVDVAAVALEELARLHAPRFGDPSLARLEWLDTNSRERTRVVRELYHSVLPGFLERFGAVLDDTAIELCQALGRSEVAWTRTREEPRTVVHVDYRVDNLLIHTEGPRPTVAVVDWQTLNLGNPAADAAYLLGGSLPLEARREHERALLREYHRALVAGGVAGYGWDRLWLDYRRHTTAGVSMAVIASMLVGQTERGDAMFTVMAQRHTAHARDLDVLEVL